MELNYLQWLAEKTPTLWWHDSADPDELKQGLNFGATGVTTNPILVASAIGEHPQKWAEILSLMKPDLLPQNQAEYLLEKVTVNTAKIFEPVYIKTESRNGYVCAQVDPAKAGDRDIMLHQAKQFHKWAPNIAVKLPVTYAGLDILEECISEGITITATVSFTVPQILEISRRYRKGVKRAEKNGVKPGLCFPVIMIGRLDDYLREVAEDTKANITESDIKAAGLAITKRAYKLYKEEGCNLRLVIAALRGTHHILQLAGGKLIMSIHPKIQKIILSEKMERALDRINEDMPKDSIERLSSMPEFIKAYEPDGLKAEEFISYGVTQRTLSQFSVSGWKKLETFKKN